MDQSQSLRELVFQVLQFFIEHDRGHVAVAIDQRELRIGLLLQDAGHDGQDRRDA